MNVEWWWTIYLCFLFTQRYGDTRLGRSAFRQVWRYITINILLRVILYESSDKSRKMAIEFFCPPVPQPSWYWMCCGDKDASPRQVNWSERAQLRHLPNGTEVTPSTGCGWHLISLERKYAFWILRKVIYWGDWDTNHSRMELFEEMVCLNVRTVKSFMIQGGSNLVAHREIDCPSNGHWVGWLSCFSCRGVANSKVRLRIFIYYSL